MITLKRMKWSNFFSYGKDNEIIFDKDILTQISGENGSGKSSVVLILEEVLFGKNFKNIKKGDIPNWNAVDNGLAAELEFIVDEIPYKISYVRRTSIKLTLTKDGKDISGHTSTQTYKEVERILGLNYRTFSQLIYQSSKNSLQFLTTTDTARKEFLISLFGLEEYSEYLDKYKKAARDVTSAKLTISGECKSLADFITRYSAMDFNKKDIEEIPETPTDLSKELGTTEKDLKNITSINNSRNKNNTYRELLEGIDMAALISSAKPIDTKQLIADKGAFTSNSTALNSEIRELSSITSGPCPKCRQEVDNELLEVIISEDKDKVLYNTKEIKDINEKLTKAKAIKDEYDEAERTKQEFENLSGLYDEDLDSEILDSVELSNTINRLTSEIRSINKNITDITRRNSETTKKNSKIDIVKKQLEEHRIQLQTATESLSELEKTEVNINILKKAFSNTGLVAFKLEFLAKTLETEINKYLSMLSDGQFVLEFVLEGEKLNIKLTNNGKETNMIALSSGQENRVNTATLLAIRKLMSNISGSKINLLILDEVMSTLDTTGKETLVELLLQENDLNTFLVDHSYSHPLLASINVEIEKGISRLEKG